VGKILQCARRELARHSGRALANVLGYGLAISFMVILGHVFLFSDAEMKRIMAGTGTHFMAFVPARAEDATIPLASPGGTASATSPVPPTDDKRVAIKPPLDFQHEGFLANTIPTRVISLSVLDELKQFPDLFKDASPYLMFRMRESRTGLVFSVGGFDPANNQAVGSTCCAKGDLVSGEFLTPQDRGLAMLEEGYARGRMLKIGDIIGVGGDTFKIKGIVNPGVRPAKVDVYLPYPDAERVISRRLRIPLDKEMNVILIEVTHALRQDAAIEKVKELLQAGIVTSYACYQPASQVLGLNRRTATMLAVLLALGVMSFAMKSQYASIIERRRDFGILKAIGWPDGVIFRQVLAESLLQSIAGGVVGCLAGLATVLFLPVQSLIGPGVTTFVSAPVIGSGLFIAAAGGMIAGLYPAFEAVRQKPAECIRHL